MFYQNQQKMGWLFLFFIFVLLASVLWQRDTIASGTYEWLLLVLLGVLAVLLIAWRHLVLVGVRTDEAGLTIVRRGFSDIRLPWEDLTVSYRTKERRAAAGLVLERGEEDEPYFLLLKDLEDEEKLREELRARLGTRYQEEG